MKSESQNFAQSNDSLDDMSSRWHDEQWVSGTYLVSEVFVRDCDLLDVVTIEQSIPDYFDGMKQRKRGYWPRGICGYYAIPIYCSDHFEGQVIQWVRSRPKYRYAKWHEPVLYRVDENTAIMNSKWGVGGIKFRSYLASRLMIAFEFLSQKYGHGALPRVNEKQIAKSRN